MSKVTRVASDKTRILPRSMYLKAILHLPTLALCFSTLCRHCASADINQAGLSCLLLCKVYHVPLQVCLLCSELEHVCVSHQNAPLSQSNHLSPGSLQYTTGEFPRGEKKTGSFHPQERCQITSLGLHGHTVIAYGIK